MGSQKSTDLPSELGPFLLEPKSTDLPSELGPFLLESLSNGGPAAAQGRDSATTSSMPIPPSTSSKSLRGRERDYFASRTADWVASLPPEAADVPGHTLPLAAIGSYPPSQEVATMGNTHRVRHHSPDDSALRGNFIPLSTSYRERASSPRRGQESHGVYLQFSLTDSQMDRLTAALSSEDTDEVPGRGRTRHTAQEPETPEKTDREGAMSSMRSRSPAKTCQSTSTPSRARSRSPVKFNLANIPESQRASEGLQADPFTTFSGRAYEARLERATSTAHKTPTRTPSRGTNRVPPAPINTDIARAHARLAAVRGGRQPPIIVHEPPERAASPVRRPGQHPALEDDASFYSQDSTGERYTCRVSPLRVKKVDPKHVSILQEYTAQQHATRGSDEGSDEIEKHGATDEASSGAELAYTPLAPFLPEGAPTVRKASKTLIGNGGWLENTSKPEQAVSPTRGGSFLGNLVKKAKEMIEAGHDSRAQRRSRESEKGRPASRQLAISLSPREQSLLYCELEFALTTALNDYIIAQFNAGRLEADKLKKVAEDWQRKGRPKVVGFRYDLETQLDLVRMHVNDFRFYSRVAATTAILGIIDTMKSNARALRVRTFCQPDTVVAKQLLDSQSLFNMLGCPEDQQIKLAEIVAFFKAAIERRRLHAMQQEQSAAGTSSSAAAASSPPRNSRSPNRQQAGGDGWFGTTATAAGELRRTKSCAAGHTDPAGYEAQNE